MGNLLFSPNGKINPADFMRGAIFLSVLLFFIKAANFVSIMLGGILALIGLVLIYCWFVIFIKRMRYAGKSGWLALAPVVCMLFIGMFMIDPMMQRLSAPDLVADAQNAILTAIEAGGLGAMFEVTEEYAQPIGTASGLQVAAARGVWAMSIAYLTDKYVKSVPTTN